MSKPHIDLMNRGSGPESMDYINNTVKEKLSTCPCDSCLDLYKKIHGKYSPMEYRTKNDLPVPDSTANHNNGWVCPKELKRPSPDIEALIRQAPWQPGKVYHSTDGRTPDIDKDGWYYFKLDNSDYSLFPKEQEVLLLTGTSFEIIQISEK